MPPTPQPSNAVLAHETARPGENTGGAFGRGTVEYRMTPTSLVLLADAATTPAARGVRVRVEHFTHVGRYCWLYFVEDDRNAVGSIWSLASGGFTVYNTGTRTYVRRPPPHPRPDNLVYDTQEGAVSVMLELAQAYAATRETRLDILQKRWTRLQCRRVLLDEDNAAVRKINHLQEEIEDQLEGLAPAVCRELETLRGLWSS